MADLTSQEKDLLQYGSKGIDTQYERDLINYRPKFEYKKVVVGGNGLSADTASQDSLDNLTDITPSDEVWTNVVNVIDSITAVNKNLSEKLANAIAKVSDSTIGDVKEAAEEFGYQITDNLIPFKLYQDSFSRLGSWEATCIQEAWEAYQAGVNGELNAELYTDVQEIQADWNDMIPFINNGLFGQIVSSNKYPTDIKTDDVNLQAIQTANQQLLDTYAQLLKLMQVNEQILLQLTINEYGSQNYFDLDKEVKEDRKKLDDLKRRLYTLGEVTSLIEGKVSYTSDNIEFISNSIDFASYDGEEQDIVLHIMRQYVGKTDMLVALKKLQAIMQLSVDKKIVDTDSDKMKLRGIANQNVKRKINQSLVNGVHLRNEVFGDVQGVMEYFDGIPNNDTFEQVANHIVNGMVQAESSYQSQSMDFYKVHTMDAEVRTGKLRKLIDKEGARTIYKIINAILAYIQQTNKWPNNDSLTDWVSDFMGYYKTL